MLAAADVQIGPAPRPAATLLPGVALLLTDAGRGTMAVDYSGPARRIVLERGEAYFDVTEDPRRPFTVDLGVRSVTAVGTAFNIRKSPERYQVAVVEGAVAFHAVTDGAVPSPPPVSADGRAVPVSAPGQRRVEAGWVAEFDVSTDVLTAFRPESMDRYRDWRSGMISFDRAPLYQVVKEMNRYSLKKILDRGRLGDGIERLYGGQRP